MLASVYLLRAARLGGIEEFELALSRRLRDRGERHLVVLMEPPPDVIARMFAEAGADVAAINLEAGGVHRLRRLCRARGVDVALYGFFGLHYRPWLAAMMNGPRPIYWDHASVYRRRPAWFLPIHAAERLLYRWSGARFVAVSQFVHRRLVELERVPPMRVRTIYNGINLDRFRPGPRDPEFVGPAPILATAAHLIPEKGLHDLLEATALLASRHPRLALLVAGDGPERARLEATARRLRIDERVRFLGLRNDVERILRACDVAVVPSLWPEAFGLVIAEAMACGRAVVATRVGAIPEVVTDGETGVLVPPGDPAALAQGIDRLCSDPALRARMGEAGRRRAERNFDLRRMVDETVALYDEVRGL